MTMIDSDGLPVGWFSAESVKFYNWLATKVKPGGIFVEVGSYLGRSAAVAGPILRAARARLICVDTWAGSVGDLTEAKARELPLEEVFAANMQHLGLQDFVEPIKEKSLVAARGFADRSLTAVFIDADHRYEAVQADIAAWAPKVAPGGFIAGHDYRKRFPGVIRAVNEAFGKPKRVVGSCWAKQLR